MSALTLERLEREVQQLPSLSLTVMEALAVIDRGEGDLAELEKTIGQDPGLAARILRVANSPFYGFSGHIGSIKEACIVLGLYTIRNLVLAAGIIGRFPPKDGGHFDRLALWRHAVGVGVAAKVLARRHGFDQDLAFTAGLLHDIGKLVLDACFPAEFARVLAHRDAHECLIREAEEAVLGFDHGLVGARAAKHWRLPPGIVEAIEAHHRPGHGPASALVDIVHVADILCRGLEIGDGGDDLIPCLDPGAMARLRLTWEALAVCLPEIEEINAATNLLADEST